ncbi:MAG: hypothetical protein V1704_00135 [Candidatus Vogelbacteria bacterium]
MDKQDIYKMRREDRMDNDEFRSELELAVEIQRALRGANYTPELTKSLIDPGNLLAIKEVLAGRMEICPLESVIDLGVEPLPDSKLTVYKHEKYKRWRFVPGQIKLYRSPSQVEGKSIRGDKLLGERGIRDQCLGNACLFDWFRKNCERIPTSWVSPGAGNWRVCFPGTTLRDGESHLGVRCMVQLHQEWNFTQFMRLKEPWCPNDYILYIDPPVSR